MGKLEAKKQEKKEKILQSAYALFIEKSLETTSISDIAHRAGVAKGTFYLYFHDKYALYEMLVASRSNDIIVKALNSLDHESLKTDEDKIFALMNEVLNRLQNDKSLLSFIAKNLSWGIFKNALLSASSNEYFDFKKLFASFVIEDGHSKYKDPEIMIFMIIELTSSTCYSVILDETPTTFEHLKPYLYKTIAGILEMFRIENAKDRPTAEEVGFDRDDVCSDQSVLCANEVSE